MVLLPLEKLGGKKEHFSIADHSVAVAMFLSISMRRAIMQDHGALTWFGSIVQNGKFSAGMPIFVRTLKSVLFPTFGSPTIPICKSDKQLESTRLLLPSV